QQNARVAMDRIVRELRMAGSGVPMATNPSVIIPVVFADRTEIRFLADLENASTTLLAQANAAATSITVSSASGFSTGDSFYIADDANWQPLTVTSVNGTTIGFTPALTASYDGGGLVTRPRTIRYSLVCEAPPGMMCPSYPYTLKRDGGGGQLHPLAEKIEEVILRYYDSTSEITPPVPSERLQDIRRIAIAITTSDILPSEGTRSYTLTSEVRPRNLGL
ncbi:MAG: PilW family protein, partial [Candidatus Methylomirabilales bacterium]